MNYEVIISNHTLNSYGFWVLTSGIDIKQYKRNPVMLYMHTRSFSASKDAILPIGHLENIRVDGENLLGTLVFDETDDFSKSIKAKWDAGTLRAVSAGLIPVTWSDDQKYVQPGQKYATLVKSKLIEVSVVDICSNDDALAFYDKEGTRINLAAGESNPLLPLLSIPKPTKMNEAVLLALSLPAGSTDAQVVAALQALNARAAKADELATQVTNLKTEIETVRLSAITAAVESAIADKRITADKKEHFVEIGKTVGLAKLGETLALFSPAAKPSEVINGKGLAGAEGWKKLSDVPADKRVELRANDKAQYIRLFEAEYGYPCVLND